jgi:hypothetical protein
MIFSADVLVDWHVLPSRNRLVRRNFRDRRASFIACTIHKGRNIFLGMTWGIDPDQLLNLGARTYNRPLVKVPNSAGGVFPFQPLTRGQHNINGPLGHICQGMGTRGPKDGGGGIPRRTLRELVKERVVEVWALPPKIGEFLPILELGKVVGVANGGFAEGFGHFGPKI